ncbi:META domain-containing protein [Psychromonas sp. Urea-02u-13]|uniref:META domain-containing protein n=1 Tax=Psychromonas sp. Urea-02u-13 TaxID=2058326 RepID=UPI000C3228FF|nr:META domain-containing protein [Psychromonas sp. Urea-02u-13]PKG40698.1 heat-shock protein HslJ [Psychromonas sp. Urea-02u-13]
MKLAPLVVLSLSTLLFACSNESNVNTETTMQVVELQDLQKEWQLVSIDNSDITVPSSLSVDDQTKANGNLACNNFFGNLELQENKLRIDKMGSTRKMCEPEVNSVEMTVSSTLSTWSDVKIIDQTLTLTGEKHTLVYSIK